jgi:radical SAM protein with 4Fe4S-binding SPASM domain
MTAARRSSCHLQRHPAVRLRREAWGGVAFHRRSGDLLELDPDGFAVLNFLSKAQSPAALSATLRQTGRRKLWPDLAAFLRALEDRGFIHRVDSETASLPSAPGSEPPVLSGPGLRAPLVAHWAVSYRCNLQCAFCYSESGPQREAGPGPDLRRRLVDRLAEWGVLEVALGGGEPTILPDFGPLLAAIREAGLVPNVTTNGTIATPAVLAALAEHAGVVHLSADRPELLDEARGSAVFGRLRGTARLLRQVGVRLGLNLLLTPVNSRAIRRSLDTALELGVEAVTFLRPKGAWVAEHWPGFPSQDDLSRVTRELTAFLAERPRLRLYVDTALRGEWSRLGLLDDPEPEVLGCGGGQRHVAITPEGDVYPCSHLRRPEFRLGNLLTDELDHLWLSGSGVVGRQRYQQWCAGTTCPCSQGEGGA